MAAVGSDSGFLSNAGSRLIEWWGFQLIGGCRTHVTKRLKRNRWLGDTVLRNVLSQLGIADRGGNELKLMPLLRASGVNSTFS